MLSITENLEYKISDKILKKPFFYIFSNKFLTIKAKYKIAVTLHWTPLLEPLSVLLLFVHNI
jgi:hypothetical protein